MKVYNAAQEPIVVRAFAASQFVKPDELITIQKGEVLEVFGPPLPEFCVREPYRIMGDVLVRDWGPLQIQVPDGVLQRVFITRGAHGFHKQSFQLKPESPNLVEGVLVSYVRDSRLIQHL